MKLYYSKSFIVALLFLNILFISGFMVGEIPLWIAILLLAPVLEITFHEYIHAFVAWLHGIKVEYIMCNFSTMCCKLVSLPRTHENLKIYHRIIFAGGLFQIVIYSFEITFLILSGIFLHNILPFIFAGMFIFTFILYNIIPERCDLRRTYVYAKWLQSQSL